MQTTTEPRRTVLDQMREAWDSDRCPACDSLKQARVYWFCKMCWWDLPKDIKKALKWRPWKAAPEWLQAMSILKKAREKTHG